MATGFEARVRAALKKAGLEDAQLEVHDDGRFEASGLAWAPVVVQGLGAEPIWIRLPATAHGSAAATAKPLDVAIDAFDAEVLEEGRAYVASLLAQGAIEGVVAGAGPNRGPPRGPQRGPRGPTHELSTDAHGRRRLRRKGFD